jgi:hypothetical protein
MSRLRCEYNVTRADVWACCRRYEVKERKLLIGASSSFSAGSETKLKQKSLFAWAKSYVASKTADSWPGLGLLADILESMGKLAVSQTSP